MVGGVDSRFAGVVGLGSFKQTYKSQISPWIVVGAAVVVGGGLLWVISDSMAWWTRLFVIALIILTGIVPVWVLWSDRSRIVALYEGGLAVQDIDGLHEVRWEDIHSLYERWGALGGESAHIETRDGTKLKLGGIQEIPELWSAVRTAVVPRLLAERLAAIESGKVLSFGPFEVSARRLKVNRGRMVREVPWGHITSFETNEAGVEPMPRLTVSWNNAISGRKESIPLVRQAVPDVVVFTALCRHLMGKAAGT